MGYDGSLKFDTKIDPAGFTSGIAQLKSTALSAISAIGAAFSAGAIAKALVGQISLVEQYGSAINDQSQKLSISKKAYQELSYMFSQTGGSVDTLQMGIKTLSNAVVDGSKAFDVIGVSLEKARSMSQEDLFNLVLQQLAEMPPSAERTAAAVDLLGRSATELNPLFNMGAEGLARMRQEAANYGLIMTDQAVAATDEYGDATALAQKAGEALRNAMVGKMLPTLTQMQKGFADLAKESTDAFNARGISGVVDVITDRFPVATAAVTGLVTAFTAMVIIQTIQKGMATFAATEAILTAATQYGTLAQWQELGALTAKQIVVAALTGEVGIATAAQWLFNAAIEANPVMVLVTAIGILVGSVVLLTKNFDKLYPSIAETREELDALDKSMSESKQTFDETLDSVDKQRFGLEEMVDILGDLSASYSGSSAEQSKMQSLCDSLNSKVNGLNLSFDAQTGKLSQNESAIRNQIEAQYELARASAASARFQELVAAQLDAQYEQRKAQVEFDKYHSADGTRLPNLDFGSGYYAAGQSELNMQKAAESVDTATAALESFDAFLKTLGIDLGLTTKKTDQASLSLTALKEAERGVGDETERIIIGGYDFTDSLEGLGMTADEVAGRLDNFTGAAQNMFEKINTKSKVSVKSMISNLNSNTAAMEQWGANIATLGAKLPADLLQPLVDQGPEKMAGVLNNLAGASDADLAKLTEAFANGGDAAKQAWLESLGAGVTEGDSPLVQAFEGTEQAAANAGQAAGQAIITAISSQDYTSATTPMTAAFLSGFTIINNSFADLLRRIHYNLATATGGVKSDILDMVSTIKRALAEIPTNVTINVNVLYNGVPSGGGSGVWDNGAFPKGPIKRVPFAKGIDYVPYDGLPATLHLGESVLTADEARLWRALKGGYRATAAPLSSGAVVSGSNALRATQVSGGNSTSMYVPITIEGRVESDAQLSRRIRNDFSEVIMNGRR